MTNNEVSKSEVLNQMISSRSLFFKSAEIYANNFAGFYEFGPIGNKIRLNIIDFWRKEFVRKNNFQEISGSIILPKDVFVASGHLKSFDDPIASCQKCKSSYKLDKLISNKTGSEVPEKLSEEEYQKLIGDNNIVCDKCGGKLGNITRFNLMAPINIGAQQGNIGYLRGESCQSIFIDFNRIYKTGRSQLPIVISQHGVVYRNEISPRNGLLRCREFEQLETEMFFDADKINDYNVDKDLDYKIRFYLIKDGEEKDYTVKQIIEEKIVDGKLFVNYLILVQRFLESIGFKHTDLRFREVDDNDRAFYSKFTFDLEVKTEKEWVELFCYNYRTDYDLSSHSTGSKKDLSIKEEGKTILPHVLEICSIGLGRLFYLLLDNNFEIKEVNGEKRNVLLLKPKISPYFCSILPLMKKDGLLEKAQDIYSNLEQDPSLNFEILFDEKGSIGKRYARLDEIGCNYCITIDHQTKEDNTVTIRDRNTFDQKRISLDKLNNILLDLYLEKTSFDKI